MKTAVRILKIILPFFLTAVCVWISYQVYTRWTKSVPAASVGILDNDPEGRLLDVSAFTACLKKEGYQSMERSFSTAPDIAARVLIEQGCKILVVSSVEKQDYSALFRLAEENELCLLFVGEPPEQNLLNDYDKAWCLRFSPVSGGELLGLSLKDAFASLPKEQQYEGENFEHEVLYLSLLPIGDVRGEAVLTVLNQYGFFPQCVTEEEMTEGKRMPQFILCETISSAYDVLRQAAERGWITEETEGQYSPKPEQPLYLALFAENQEEVAALQRVYPNSIMVYRDIDEIASALEKMVDNLLNERYPTFQTNLPSEDESFFNLEYHCAG